MFPLSPAPGTAALLRTGHSSTAVIMYVLTQSVSIVSSSVPVGLSVSVCDLGTSVVESRAKILGLAQTSASISFLYQARGEDSLGLRGFSGVWVSLRALWKIKPVISSDLCSFYHGVFRLRAHSVVPLTAALCSLITPQLQADGLSATLGA